MQPTEGVQIFIESREPTIFKDRTVINVTDMVVGGPPSNQIYVGIFNYVEINATIELGCTSEFQGTACEIFCGSNCGACQPGFAGRFCATDIDYCSGGVTCGQNQRCVDGVLNYTCVCEPGYTGPDCSVNIDDCVGVDCNGGQCVDGTNSFLCDCREGFTGALCTDIDRCAGVTCGQNQRCVNEILTFTCVCIDGLNCSVCSEPLCQNNGQCVDDGRGSFTCYGDDPVKLIIIISAVATAALLLVLVISLFTMTGCLLSCAKRRKQLRSVGNTTEAAIYSTPDSLNITPVNSNLPGQSGAASTPNEYDYPIPFQDDKESYHLQRCPAYSVTDGNPTCKPNPAYAIVDTESNGEADDHIYY